MRTLKYHSFANLDEITYQHLHWTFSLDFETKKIKGAAEYDFKFIGKKEARAPVLVLDTNHLVVEKAFVDGKNVDFKLEEEDKVFGRALVVPINADSKKVRVEYSSTDLSSGVQWLPKEQTAGKTHPFLFTQCQAIHARTIIPCPDTPACKITYSAKATVPEWSTCLMSAIADEAADKKQTANGATREFNFRQEVPIPSYLLAIVAGCMESRELGPRSRVWSEPSVVEKAAFEFSQTEEFLQHAEEITAQEYVWKRYDLVCLPPSFPYGGMENPCLTFVTPTLLAGDRSLADVVAHEIAHSWTGNLVTNRSWKDFWLNEGWTMWLQRKIMVKIYNDPLAYDLSATIGLRDLADSVEDFGCSHAFTHLVPDVDDVDPDDVFSSVPYEKGFNFLHYLTQVVGGHEVFEEFAKAYIKNFRYKTLTSEDFRQFFMKYFTETVDKKKQIQQINWDKWYNTPGMPLIQSEFDSTQTNQAISLGVNMSKSVDAKTWGPVTGDTVAKWPCALQVLLLDTLITEQLDRQTNLTKKHLDMIDNFANKTFTTSRNSEIRSRWYTIALRAKDDRQFANTASFLKEQGRMKYVRPLYRDLAKAAGVAHAKSVFARTKSIYHPIAAKMIQKDLDDAEAKEAEMKTTNIPSNPGCTFACVEKCVAQYVNLPKGWTGYALIAGVAVTAAFLARRR